MQKSVSLDFAPFLWNDLEITKMAGNPQTLDVVLALLAPFLLCALYIVVRFVWKLVRNIRVTSQFPCAPYHRLYGNMHLTDGYFGDKFLAMERETVKKHPRVSAFWLAGCYGEVRVTHPETIKELLKTPTTKSTEYRPFRFWLGNGLFMSHGEAWKVRRRLLTNAFHFGVLKQYMGVYNSEASKLIDRLSEYAKKGESFEMFQQAKTTTTEVLLQCAFSGESKMTEDAKKEYVAAIKRMQELLLGREFNPLYYLSDFIFFLSPGGREYKRLCRFVHHFAESIIKHRRKYLESNQDVLQKKKRPDFIDILLRARDEDGRGLTDEEIREEVDTVLFAGHDTTASTLAWTLYSLAQHPEHQQKVQEEVEEVLSNRDADTVDWEDLSKMPYLTQCLKEAMRLHSPVPFVSRTIKEDTFIDGIKLPKDSDVGILFYGLHHNPEVWGPDHMQFDPSRFHPDRVKAMDSHAFLPFSVGPRNCIGQTFAMNEERVLLARLLHKFTFELDPSLPVEKEHLLVAGTRAGMWMTLRPNQQ